MGAKQSKKEEVMMIWFVQGTPSLNSGGLIKVEGGTSVKMYSKDNLWTGTFRAVYMSDPNDPLEIEKWDPETIIWATPKRSQFPIITTHVIAMVRTKAQRMVELLKFDMKKVKAIGEITVTEKNKLVGLTHVRNPQDSTLCCGSKSGYYKKYDGIYYDTNLANTCAINVGDITVASKVTKQGGGDMYPCMPFPELPHEGNMMIVRADDVFHELVGRFLYQDLLTFKSPANYTSQVHLLESLFSVPLPLHDARIFNQILIIDQYARVVSVIENPAVVMLVGKYFPDEVPAVNRLLSSPSRVVMLHSMKTAQHQPHSTSFVSHVFPSALPVPSKSDLLQSCLLLPFIAILLLTLTLMSKRWGGKC